MFLLYRLWNGVSVILVFPALAEAPQNNPADKTVMPVTNKLMNKKIWIFEPFVVRLAIFIFNGATTTAAAGVDSMGGCKVMQSRSVRMALSLTREEMGAHYLNSIASRLLFLIH